MEVGNGGGGLQRATLSLAAAGLLPVQNVAFGKSHTHTYIRTLLRDLIRPLA